MKLKSDKKCLKLSSRLLYLSGPVVLVFGLTFSSSSSAVSFYNGAVWQVSRTSLVLNEWQHLAYSQNERNMTIYLNGVQIYRNKAKLIVPTGTFTRNWIGNVDGSLDELRIFNESLNQSQVADLMLDSSSQL